MTTGRTADLKCTLGTSSAVHDLAFLGGSITSSAGISNEAFYGEEIEEASIHTVGASMDFSTVYDTAALDSIISGLLGSRYSSTSDVWAVFWASVAPVSFQAWPVSFSRPGYDAPAADAISRPWSLRAKGRGVVGTVVRPFTIDADGSAVTLLGSGFDRDQLGADPVILLAISSSAGATQLHLDDGNNATQLAERNGIQGPFALSTTDGALTIDCSTQDVTGVAFIGRREELPSG